MGAGTTPAGALEPVGIQLALEPSLSATTTRRVAVAAGFADVIQAEGAKRWRAGSHCPPSPGGEEWVRDSPAGYRDDRSPPLRLAAAGRIARCCEGCCLLDVGFSRRPRGRPHICMAFAKKKAGAHREDHGDAGHTPRSDAATRSAKAASAKGRHSSLRRIVRGSSAQHRRAAGVGDNCAEEKFWGRCVGSEFCRPGVGQGGRRGPPSFDGRRLWRQLRMRSRRENPDVEKALILSRPAGPPVERWGRGALSGRRRDCLGGFGAVSWRA